MASLAHLLQRLVAIQNACVDPATLKRQAEEERQMDDFAKCKRDIRNQITAQRKLIADRDELMRRGGGAESADTVKLSTQIRQNLKQLKKDAERLEDLQREEKEKIDKRKKSKVTEEDLARVAKREELVDLTWQHLDEVRSLEKVHAGGMLESSDSDYQDPLVTELPEIEGDEQFMLLKQKDEQIDAKIYVIEDGIAVLKEMAISIGQEVDVQTLMIQELDEDVDHAAVRLDSLNRRLKQTLQDVRKGDRFCMDIICCIILLALIGVLWQFLSSSFA